MRTKLSAVKVGTAGEYLAAARLTLWGYEVSIAPQDTAYDMVVGRPGSPTLLAAQVKTLSKPASERPSHYKWKTFRGGGAGVRYTKNDADIFILVALDIERLHVIPARDGMPKSVNRPITKMMNGDEQADLQRIWDDVSGGG